MCSDQILLIMGTITNSIRDQALNICDLISINKYCQHLNLTMKSEVKLDIIIYLKIYSSTVVGEDRTTDI